MTQQTPEQPEQPEQLEPFDGEAYQDAKHYEKMIAQGERARIIERGLASLKGVETENVPEGGTNVEVQGEPDEHTVDVHFDQSRNSRSTR